VRRRRLLQWLAVTVLAAAAPACGAKAAPKTVELEVRGMVCESCVEAITHTVSGLEGVTKCEVDLESERAHVTYAPDVIEVAAIEAAIDELGYDATPLTAGE
jgi:Cu+-exporting ATPase